MELRLILSTFILFLTLPNIFALGKRCSQQNPCGLKGGNFLTQCRSYVSHRGFLSMTLNVDVTTQKFDWLRLRHLSYNKMQCPPTWRVLPGDKASVKITNKLMTNNNENQESTVELRTHGLQLSAETLLSDSPIPDVKPGQTFTYKYGISPDQPSGTYWYNTEVRGSLHNQFNSGLTGALIVEDNPSDTPAELNDVSCPNNCQHDVMMVFNTFLAMGKYRERPEEMRYLEKAGWRPSTLEWSFDNINEITVNGQIQPILTMARGQMKRIRMINTDPSSTLELQILNVGTGTTCQTREIAFDGSYLDQPRQLIDGRSIMKPTSTLDWLIRCDVPGNYTVIGILRDDQDVETHSDPYFLTLLEVVEFGIENSMFPTTFEKRSRTIDGLKNKFNDEVIVKQGKGMEEVNPKSNTETEEEAEETKEGSSNKFGYLGLVVIASILIMAAAYKMQ